MKKYCDNKKKTVIMKKDCDNEKRLIIEKDFD